MAKRVAGDLAARLVLETTPFEENADKAKKITWGLEKDIDGKVDKINKKLKEIGLGLSAGITLPLTLFGKQALDTFTGFEQSMQNTFSVMGATSAEMEALRQKAEEMGATTRFSASQASDALYNLGSAGQSASQAMSSLDGVLRLAGATGSDLAFTSETIASTISQFNLEADKASHIADVYAMAISKSQANMTKLSYSMKYVGPVASGLNIKLETATAALMKLYNTGYGGEMAGTYLRAGLQKLASGTDDFKSKLESIGLTYDDVNPKTNDFADIIDRLKEKQVDINKANELFGDIAGGAMSKLIEGGGEAIRTMDGLLQASDGAAEKMQDIQNASFANTKAELASAFEAVQITLTSNVIPAVNIFAKGITAVLKAINDMPVGLQVAGQGFAAIAAIAGPLLLIAANVTKIKTAWAALNAVMAANPILIWGAAVAAAGAVATGIIAQVRKAHEDYIHGAKKGVEEVKSLQEKAKKTGDEGRKIQSLFTEYESLKNKTKKTADEQARYNQLLLQLKELVPSVTEKLNEQGDAVIENEEKITQAIKNKLERERALNEMALTQAKIRKKQAEIVAKTYKGEEKSAFDALNKKQEYVTKLDQFYTKVIQFDKNLKDNNKVEVERLRAEILKDFHSNKFSVNFSVFQHGEAGAAEHTRKYLLKQNDLLTKAREKYQKVVDIKNEQENAIKIFNELKEKEKQFNQTLNELNNPVEPITQTKEQAINDLMQKWEEFKTVGINAVKERKKIEGETFNESKEYYEFLKREIKETADLQNIVDSNGNKIKLNAEDLKKAIELRDKFKKKERVTGTGIKDNSYQAQIAELDKLWQSRISKAKEYGQNENEVRKQYLEKRRELIENAIKQEKETGEKTETKKGSGVTLADELKKTELLGLGGFAKYIQQQKELRSELKKTQEEIIATQDKIAKTKARIEEAEKNGKSRTEIEALNQDLQTAKAYSEQLEEKAQNIRVDINEAELSFSQIKNGLSDIEKIGKSKLQIQLINIEEERKRLLKIIEESRRAKIEAAKDNAEEIAKIEANAAKQRNKVNKDADMQAQNATAEVANTYLQGAIGIANTLTDVIASAIEKGGVDGLSAIAAAGDIIGQVGKMIPEPITQAVLGGISAAVEMATKIVGALNKQVEKEVAEANKKADELERKRFNELNNNISGVFENIIKRIYGVNKNHLNWEKALDIGSLEVQRKKIDDFLKKAKDLETTETRDKIRKRTVTKGEAASRTGWGRFVRGWSDFWSLGLAEIQWQQKIQEEYIEKEVQTVGQLYEEIEKARAKGDKKTVERLQQAIQKALEEQAKKEGINLDKIDGISNYVQGLDNALASYIKTGDMKAFKKAMKNALYEAVVQKAVFNSMLAKITEDLNLVEQGKMSMEDFEKSLETMGEEAKKHAEKLAKAFGIEAPTDNINTEWKKVGETISSALSSALGDAAYNADWGSFKKSFASEMKKAIIQSAIESAGIKAKVDEIIKRIVADGKVTAEEVKDGISELQPLYDSLEKMMAEAANFTKSLEGGVEIKTESKGNIIQQLSGADRDAFLETIKKGFSTINQSIDLKDATIQHLTATQIIINSLTYNSHNSQIYITATENTDLKGLISEMVKQALEG